MSAETRQSCTVLDEIAVPPESLEVQPDPMEELSPAVSGVGEQLRVAREAKGLAAADVAKALKLSQRQIEALEADNWAALPCTTIIRGFVRNYARLLGLNADQFMAQLGQQHMPQIPELDVPAGTPVQVSYEGQADRRDFVRVASGFFVLILAMAAYFFFPQELWQSTVEAVKAATQSKPDVQKALKTVSPASDAARQDEPVVVPPASTILTDSAVLPAAAVPPAISAPPATAGSVLKFDFAKASWVEVRDRSGQIIFSQLNPAGSRRDIEGQPPFALVIGNAQHVSLQYKGQPVELSSRRSKDDVVRLSLE